MRIASQHGSSNLFEKRVLLELTRWKLDGVATNNLILPHQVNALPNEHDLVLALEGRVVTVDMKELFPGKYSDSGAGWWHEASGSRSEMQSLMHPAELALKKAKVLEGYVKGRRGEVEMPAVLSGYVVPNECDIDALRGAVAGRSIRGARHFICRLEELEEALANDVRAFPQRRPIAEDSASVMGFDKPPAAPSVLCRLSDSIVVERSFETRRRPIERTVYLGADNSLRTTPGLRIEVCEYGVGFRPVLALLRAQHTNLEALRRVRNRNIITLRDSFFGPTAAIFHYERFSEETLHSSVQHSGMLSWPEARLVLARLCDALDEAHGERVFHRYLDPECVLVAPKSDWAIRVRDFFGASTAEKSTVGVDAAAEPYDAPERGDGTPSTAALDWYSAGRICRYALTGDAFGRLPAGVPRTLGRVLDGLAGSPEKRASAWPEFRKLVNG